jgi:hypothetical protein
VRTVLGSAELNAESASLLRLEGCGEARRDGYSVPVLWILEELMFPMLDIIDRHCSPWRFEFFRCSNNRLLIDVDVFVIVFDLESSKTLNQQLLTSDWFFGLCSSHASRLS